MIAAILLAAGHSQRMGSNKMLQRIGEISVLERSLRTLLGSRVERVIVVAQGETMKQAQALTAIYQNVIVVSGGERRQDSVYEGLQALRGGETEIVVIHDGARCMITSDLIDATIESAQRFGSGVLGLPARDSVKIVNDYVIERTVPRETVYLMQTPQTFEYGLVLRAYEFAIEKGIEATDDAAFVELLSPVHIVKGDERNIKLTTPQDWERIHEQTGYRVGLGEDVHRLQKGLPLVLGGVTIPHASGLLGHSDADVLAHAVTDALLGAAALGDIGRHFPDTDGAYKNANSLELLTQAYNLVKQAGYGVVNLDCVITAQQPKIAPYIRQMQNGIAAALDTEPGRISVKATTAEGMGALGREEGIGVRCVALLAPQ